MDWNIVKLSKSEYKGTALPNSYKTNEIYGVIKEIDESNNLVLRLFRKKLDEPFIHDAEKEDFPDSLYQDHFENALAFGVKDGKALVAAIEVNEEKWSNRLRVTELWVKEGFRRKGIGKSLMDKAKAVAEENGNRAIILETQTSNVDAIAFYLSQGFGFGGIDLTCYGNDDVSRGEVRLELVYLLN